MATKGQKFGIAGAVVGAGAAGLGAAMGVRRYMVGRVRLRPDSEADEPFGRLRGRPLTVLADDGLPLHVEIDGDERAALNVVFCHGYCLNQDSWHYQRRDLRKEGGVRLVFWDQRSHGRSGRSTPVNATVEHTGEDLHTVLRATIRPGEPVILVGHSMGGMTIMALAERHPALFGRQVAGVLLLNTSPGNLKEMTLGLPLVLGKMVSTATPGVVRTLSQRAELIDRTRHVWADLAFMVTRRMAFGDKRVSPTVVDFLEQMIRATPAEVIAEFYPALRDHDKLAALVALGRVPTVVMTAGADRLTPPDHGRAIADAVPDTELIEVPGAGHALMLEDPGLVTGTLRGLIARVRPAPWERSA